jgi:tryptophan synthase alpha chain
VSDGRQAGEVASYAEAVIVGSAFVRAVLDADGDAAAIEAVGRLTGDLARGVRGEL